MKSTFITLLLLCSITVLSQQPTSVNTDYLKKSKNQKKVALIMLGGGATLLLTGIIIPKGELIHSGFLDDTYKNDGIKGAFELTGIVSMLGSIPLFIASSKNKKKAAAISFKMETVPEVQQQSFVYHSYPALSFSIPIH